MKSTRHHAAVAVASLLAVFAGAWPAAGQTVEYYHLDALGSVRAVTDQTGAVLERHDYLPFGEEWNPQPSTDPRMFTGKERDTETGYDYFGARYLSAKTARFTTTDPTFTLADNLVDPQRWNRYVYVRNNPLRYVDSDGRVIFDYQMFRAFVAEAATVGQEGHGYLVPGLSAVAAAGSIANDVLLLVGVGEGIQAVRAALARSALELGAAAVEGASDGLATEAGSVATKGETRFTAAGRRAHAQEPLPPGFERDVGLPSGKRMDGYNASERQVIEIKPDNPRAVQRGGRQVEGYCRECDQTYGPGHTGRVQTYDPAKYVKEK